VNDYNFIIGNMIWSYSRLNGFYNCPYAWKLQYIDENKSENGFFGEYGSFCHLVLEKYFNNEISMFELSQFYEDEYKNNIKHYAPPNAYVDLGIKYFDKGKEYFDNFSGIDDYEILGVEKKVAFNIEKYKFTGYIDLLVKNQDGDLEIIDHKSADIKPRSNRKKETKGDIKLDEYLRQLYLYSIPVYDEYKVYPKYLNFNVFRCGEWIKEPFQIEKLEEAKQWVIDTINKINNESAWLPLSDEYFCNHLCSMRKICEYKPRY